VGVEEPIKSVMSRQCRQGCLLGLRLSTVGALSVPPLRTVAIDDVSAGAVDSDLGAGDRDEGAFPLLVGKGGSALEGDL